ncbi:MAG: hypothetical protein LH606_13415 [Cytophagaceae bacterium]|nr:hypothetical protein [Cytophagaceae bacterium]
MTNLLSQKSTSLTHLQANRLPEAYALGHPPHPCLVWQSVGAGQLFWNGLQRQIASLRSQ